MISLIANFPFFFSIICRNLLCYCSCLIVIALRLIRVEKSTNIKIRHINHQRTGVYSIAQPLTAKLISIYDSYRKKKTRNKKKVFGSKHRLVASECHVTYAVHFLNNFVTASILIILYQNSFFFFCFYMIQLQQLEFPCFELFKLQA